MGEPEENLKKIKAIQERMMIDDHIKNIHEIMHKLYDLVTENGVKIEGKKARERVLLRVFNILSELENMGEINYDTKTKRKTFK